MTLSSSQPKAEDRIKLPKPDLRNITVLTRKLPNIPILPWNHYDSPGLDAGLDQEPNAEPEAKPESEVASEQQSADQ
jgi:hypothetical protein